jgi:hypothetical protein
MSYVYSTAGPDTIDANGEPVALWRIDLDTRQREPLLADGSVGRHPVTSPPDPIDLTDSVVVGNGVRTWRR